MVYQVCTHVSCDAPVEARPNQTIAVLAADELVLPQDYTGDVWATLTAYNLAGLSEVSHSSSVAVGPLDPGDGVVRWSQAVGLQSLFNASFTISGFSSAVLPITSFTYCISSEPALNDILPCVTEPSTPHAETVMLSGLTLSEPVASFSAYVTVTACNDYGYCRIAQSQELRLDRDPPTIGFVRHTFDVPTHSSEWEEVLQIVCYSAARCRVEALPGGLKPLASGLLKHEVLATDPDMTGVVGKDVAVSWGDFQDDVSGLSHTQLCCGSAPGLADVMPCTPVPTSGRAILFGIGSSHLQTTYATVRAFDRAGNSAQISSLGVTFYIASLTPSTLTHLSPYLPSCGSVPISWAPMEDDCASPIHLSVAVCDASGACTEEEAIQPGAANNATVSAPLMLPGTWHAARMRIRGCANFSQTVFSSGVVCDETGPDVLEDPIVSGTNGHAVLVHPGNATVSYGRVFEDAESPITSLQGCLLPAVFPLICKSWTSYDLADMHISQSLPADLNGSLTVVALIRATNAAGHSTDVPSDPTPVVQDPPQFKSMSVNGFDSSTDIQVGNAPLPVTAQPSPSPYSCWWEWIPQPPPPFLQVGKAPPLVTAPPTPPPPFLQCTLGRTTSIHVVWEATTPRPESKPIAYELEVSTTDGKVVLVNVLTVRTVSTEVRRGVGCRGVGVIVAYQNYIGNIARHACEDRFRLDSTSY